MQVNVKRKLLIGNKRKICRYCFTTENLTIDHKKPLVKGGEDTKKNLQYLCRRCNSTKSSLSDTHFRKLMKTVLRIYYDRAVNQKNNPCFQAKHEPPLC